MLQHLRRGACEVDGQCAVACRAGVLGMDDGGELGVRGGAHQVERPLEVVTPYIDGGALRRGGV